MEGRLLSLRKCSENSTPIYGKPGTQIDVVRKQVPLPDCGEVWIAMARFQNNKAAGVDGLLSWAASHLCRMAIIVQKVF